MCVVASWEHASLMCCVYYNARSVCVSRVLVFSCIVCARFIFSHSGLYQPAAVSALSCASCQLAYLCVCVCGYPKFKEYVFRLVVSASGAYIDIFNSIIIY